MSDLQIQKAQCLSDLTDALPYYRKQLDRIDGRLTDYIADAISDQDAHANIYELLGIGKVCHGRKKTAGGYRWKFKEQ